jgi:hypothetical protein
MAPPSGSTSLDHGPGNAFSWAAGLLEANGAFYVSRSSRGEARGRIQCRLPDEDVLLRLRHALGAGRVNGPYGTPEGSMGRRLTWVFQVNRQRDVERIASQLKPWMGGRRQGQIGTMLDAMAGVVRLLE